MSYESVRHLLRIEDVEELEEKLNQIPLNERGKTAESVAEEYSKITSGIFTKSRNKADSIGSESAIEICQEAKELIHGLLEMYEISYPHYKTCLDVALESYKATHDIEGMKRIGRIFKNETSGWKNFLEEARKEKTKDEVVYGACGKLTSEGRIGSDVNVY